MYGHRGGYPVPTWAQARDCEALHGRARAEATWGTGYYRDDTPVTGADLGLATRVQALERDMNQLFALSAIRSLEVTELAQRRHKPRY